MELWISIIVLLLYVYIFVTTIYLLLENRESSTTLAWLLVFIFVPFFGIVFYLLFGRGTKKNRTLITPQNLEGRIQGIDAGIVDKQKIEMESLGARYMSSGHLKLMRLLYRNSHSILTRRNSVKLFFQGKDKFEVLLDDFEKAQKYIHMEYFIWEADDLSDKVVEILRRKAAQGVCVRILYDSVGNHLSGRYLKRLRRAGIRIYAYYNYLSLYKLHTLNYRNHRKMVIIDGITGYIGGMNMGEEYISGGKRFPSWRDTHMRMQGQSVTVLQEIFSVSWLNTTGEVLDFIKPLQLPAGSDESVPIQITTSGPDSEWESIKQLYFLLISSAEETIFVHTPYFIPDSSIILALKTAALSGVDVRIMLTGHLDKHLPYWVALTFLKDLLATGVRVFYYTKGFMHAKTIVVDSKTCSVGTANMDIRSFQLNYEINALIYDQAVAGKIEDMFYSDMESAKEFTLEDYNRIHWVKHLRNSLSRLFAPLL
ncbi:MAG: cardiolipin synthase [Desulfobacteraceae bacterium]